MNRITSAVALYDSITLRLIQTSHPDEGGTRSKIVSERPRSTGFDRPRQEDQMVLRGLWPGELFMDCYFAENCRRVTTYRRSRWGPNDHVWFMFTYRQLLDDG